MVKVYTITRCPWCDKAKKYLKAKGVEFEAINIEEDHDAAVACQKLSGDTMVPVITPDDEHYVVGFDKAKIDALLGL